MVAAGFSRWSRISLPTTASTCSSSRRSVRSASRYDTLVRPASVARARADSRMVGFMSTPITAPSGPTDSASSMLTSPVPQPTSNTRMPEVIPARRNRYALCGARICA